MELPVLRNRELRVSFDELSRQLTSNQPPEDVIRVLSLTNKRLLRLVQQPEFPDALNSLQQPLRHVVNRLLNEKPKVAAVQREAAISQQLMVEVMRGWSLNRFSSLNSSHVVRKAQLSEKYNSRSSISNAPSPYLKLPRDLPGAEELSLFRSPFSWFSATELSLHLIEHLATFYPDLYRTLAFETSTSAQFAIPLPVIASMVGNTVLDVFSAPPAVDKTSSSVSTSAETRSTVASANLATSARSESSSFPSIPSATSNNSTNSSPSGSLLLFGNTTNGGTHSPGRTLWERDATRPFEQRLPEVVPLFFDSVLAIEEVFCVAMYIIYFLVCDHKVQVTMARMPQLLAKVQSRLKKLFAKSTKISDFKSYAMKAVKPVAAEVYEDATDQKNSLLAKIVAQNSDEDAQDAIATLIALLNEEEKTSMTPLAVSGSSSLATSTGSSPTSASLLAPTRSSERKSPEQSPARVRVSRKQTDSPVKSRKRRSSAEMLRTVAGWPWLKPHIAALVTSLASNRKYEAISLAVPHIGESRIYANAVIKLLALYVKKVPTGIADVDAIVRSLDRQNPSSPAPYSNFFEYLRLNNSVTASHVLDILGAALKAEPKPVLMNKLIDCEIPQSISFHLDIITSPMLRTVEVLQNAILDRLLELHNFQLDVNKPDHMKYFTSFWTACIGENGKQLTSAVSKQWLLLGFSQPDPTKLLKSRLPIHFLEYANESAPQRIEAVLSERLLRRNDDFSFAEVMVQISELVVTVTQASIGLTKVLPIIFSDNNFFEEVCTECLFTFNTIWTQQSLANTTENVQKVLHHLKKVLFAFLPQEHVLSGLRDRLRASVHVFGSDESIQLPPNIYRTYIETIEGKYKEFVTEQEEVARMEIVRREQAARSHARRKSATRPDHSALHTSNGRRRKSVQRRSRGYPGQVTPNEVSES